MCVRAALLTILLGAVQGLYVDFNVPYEFGSLNVSYAVATAKGDGSILHTNIFYPKQGNEYAVVYFVGGGPEGVIPSIMYEDFMKNVASHGFIVVGVDYFWPSGLPIRRRRGLPRLSSLPDTIVADHFMQFNWLRSHLHEYTGAAIPRWDHVAVGCHSAGCQVTLAMVLLNQTFVNATLFLEPASAALKAPIQFTMPAYMYGTEYASQFDPFPCSIAGMDYNHFYEDWKCPRYITEVAAYGHCDILNKVPWESCKAIHFCKVVGDWSRIYPAYHAFVQGAASAFFIGHLQGNAVALNYITTQSLMPLKMLQVANDTATC